MDINPEPLNLEPLNGYKLIIIASLIKSTERA